MSLPNYLPHIDLLLHALRINRDRLNSRSKIAIDAKLLRGLLRAIVAMLPFSEEFYLATYPDIAEAHASGQIPDLRQHFLDSGFFEGRFGADPGVDDAFYATQYKDVAKAVLKGEVPSALDHYLHTGAAEGRVPSAAAQPAVEGWMAILRDDNGRS